MNTSKLLLNIRDFSRQTNYKDAINQTIILLVYKHLSERQEKFLTTHSPDEYKQKYYLKNLGYYLEENELFSNIASKCEETDLTYIGDLTSALNNLKNAPDEIIKEVFSAHKPSEISENDSKFIIKIINLFNNSKKTNVNIFNDLKYYARMFRENGFLTTNLELSKLIAYIIKAQKDSTEEIYDPNCNIANTLVELNKRVNVGKIYGIEERYDFYRLSIIYMILNDIPTDKFDIRHENAILDDGFGNQKFDTIISLSFDTPRLDKDELKNLVLKKKFEKLIETPFNTMDYLYILEMIYHLKDDGLMVFISPSNMLFRGFGQRKVRQMILEENILDCVIQLPITRREQYSSYMGMLIFKKSRKENENIFFINASECYDTIKNSHVITTKHMKKIAKTYHDKEEIKHFSHSITLEQIIENYHNFNVPIYVDSFEAKTRDAEEIMSLLNKNQDEIVELDQLISVEMKKIR